MVDAPESRENVNRDMFALTNVLEKDTIEHKDNTSTELIYNTILDPGERGAIGLGQDLCLTAHMDIGLV